MRLYLIRHGETALNAKGCYYGRTDAVLSEKGISQARYLKEILKEISFDYIVASPLVRAYNTAQIVMEEREQEIFGDRRLMEQDFGIFEGMTYKEIQNTYPKERLSKRVRCLERRIFYIQNSKRRKFCRCA